MASNDTANLSVSKVIREEYRKNPIEDLMDVYQGRLPGDIKQVFKLVRALIVGNEIVAPVVHKLAETPITHLQYKYTGDGQGEKVKEECEEVIEKEIGAKRHLLSISFDLMGYANAFSSVYFAPKRYLICPECKKRAKKTKKPVKKHLLALMAKFKTRIHTVDRRPRLDFVGNCPDCHLEVVFERQDLIFRTKKRLRLIRWDPYYMDIDYYSILGRSVYYYKIPDEMKMRIRKGDRELLTEAPWGYIEAALSNKMLKIDQKGFYHFKTEGISGVYDGWGIPRVMSVLTALYYIMILTKANESTAAARINDLVLIHPEAKAGGGGVEDPIGTIGAQNWIDQVSNALTNFKKDKTVTTLLPFPVGVTQVYGQGKNQLVTSEMELHIRNAIAGMGLTQDVIYSSGTYTSIAVAARILANQVSAIRETYDEYLEFLVKTISRSIKKYDFKEVTVTLAPYESADDSQKTGLMANLVIQGKMASDPLLRRLGTSFEEQVAQMESEENSLSKILELRAKNQAFADAKANSIMQTMQMKAEKEIQEMLDPEPGVEPGEEGDPGSKMPKPQGPKEQLARKIAEKLITQEPPENWEAIVKTISQKDEELGGYVMAFINMQLEDDSPFVEKEEPVMEERPPAKSLGNGQAEPVIPQTESLEPDKNSPRSLTKL